MTFQDVETARKTYLEKFQKGLFITIGLVVLAGTSLFIFGPFLALPMAVMAISIGVIVTVFMTNKEKVAYRKAYKGYFVEQNLKKIFSNLLYDHQKGFSPNVIRESGMMRLANKFSSNDTVIAKYKNIAFAQADVHIIQTHTDDKGNTYDTTLFKGRYMMFEFPKKFEYRLEVVGKKFRLYQVPGKLKDRKMRKLETESTDFNHNFRIYGDDGFESFYLLAPDVIARIEDIALRYDYKLLLGFYDNKLIVALDDGKDAFEPAKFTRPIDEKAESKKVSEDIKVITDFVDVILGR